MSSDWNDPVYDEYLSTGIDPTGGELGPDLDQECDKGTALEEDENER